MAPNILKVILHLASIVSLFKDTGAAIEDLIKKEPASPDFKKAAADLASVLEAGLFAIPGVTDADIAAVAQMLRNL